MKMIIKTCPICSKKYSVSFCHIYRYLTCGYTCGGIYRRKPIINNKCFYCSSEFISKKSPTKPQKFCSRKCSAKAKINKIPRICIECNKSFEVTPYRLSSNGNRGIYCDRKCQLSHWNKRSLKKQMPTTYRSNAWRVFEKKCYDCNLVDERLLVIHHIDGNRKNGLIENLVPLCHNCHCLRHIAMSGNHRLPSYKGRD